MKLQDLQQPPPSPLQPLQDNIWQARGVELWVKRDDLLAPAPNDPLCGNKWRKLQHNLHLAREAGHQQLLTFGGAYSNHIAALASAGQHFGFRTVGVIRGEPVNNPTLAQAQQYGMQLYFMDRSTYRNKTAPEVIQALVRRFGPAYILPEGGTNQAALQGCAELGQEIIRQCDSPPTHIALACGTGGTAAGIIHGLDANTQLLGISVLKGGFMSKEITKHLGERLANNTPWSVMDDYHHGGYARRSPALDGFIQDFYQQHRILLEPIYTGKLFFALYDLVQQRYFPVGSRVVAIHTGGLQAFASTLTPRNPSLP